MILRNFASVLRIFAIFDNFQSASGATLKVSKTQLMLLGRTRNIPVPEQYKKFLVQKLKIYGILITPSGFADESNWKGLLDMLDLEEYKTPTLNLSPFGKVVVFSTYTLSKLWYLSTIITPPVHLIKKVENVLNRYLWYPAVQNKVRKGVLKLPPSLGGLGYPDIMSKVQAIWLQMLIRRYRDEEQSWHICFDHYRNKTAHLFSSRQIQRARVPQLYKEIRIAEIHFNFGIMEDHFVLRGMVCTIKTKQRLIYQQVVMSKFDRQTDRIKQYWFAYLQSPLLNFLKVWKTTKIPLVDAYSRQVHYLVLQKALNTRSKLSNFVPGMSEFCKLCPGEREDLAHVLIECERARSAWEIIDPLWTRVMGIALSSENKFFGGLVVLGKQEYWFLNMIIQVMQRAIWESRRRYENKGIILDLKLYFKRKVNVILNRALLFWGNDNMDYLISFAPIWRRDKHVYIVI